MISDLKIDAQFTLNGVYNHNSKIVNQKLKLLYPVNGSVFKVKHLAGVHVTESSV
jgi:hypothetical protein